jgi:ElaB/YqjD/DUF883 family membrane-anchored ribosome-binding protein
LILAPGAWTLECAMEKKPDPAEGGALASATANALGTIDEVRALLESATHHDLADTAASVKQKLEAAHEALETAHREKGGALGQALLGVEENLREELEEVEQRVRENPLGALLAAAGLGLLLGVVLSRHRH